MDTVEWGTNKESDKLIMKMNIKRFYDDILIKKKVLPKIRLSKKKMVYEFENPNFKKSMAIGINHSKKIAQYVRSETPSYLMKNN